MEKSNHRVKRQRSSGVVSTALILRYQDRLLFGPDFPLIPYDYEEERRSLSPLDLSLALPLSA
ncbi:MAG: hypothetical protein ACE5JD_12070 [Candidatus Methylomirabilia bacterium]